MNLLDLIFPKTCVGCSKKGIYFCPECKLKIKPLFQICPVCERPSPFGQTHPFCLSRNSLDGIYSLFAYEGIIRNAIHQLKYKFVTDLEDEFWQIVNNWLSENDNRIDVLKQFINKEKPTIIPVPLYWYKQKKRGFNQSMLISKRVADKYNLKISDKILIRKKNVVSQTKLTEKERVENVKGIFKVNPVVARERSLVSLGTSSAISVILVDDVWTTGSTLKEATRVLKEAGVKKVWGLTIAR